MALAGNKVVGVSASYGYTAAWTETGELFTFWCGDLGMGVAVGSWAQHESVPRLAQALVGTKVVGAATGEYHTAMWTEVGELLTFGDGEFGELATEGKNVVGASGGEQHTSVRTDAAELFTFGHGQGGAVAGAGQPPWPVRAISFYASQWHCRRNCRS